MLQTHTHVARDLPGYGGTRATADVGSLAQRARTVCGWIQDLPSTLLIGHSMGGVIATMIAEQRPTVGGVINVDGNVSRGDCTYSGRAIATSPDEFAARGFAELCAALGASSDPAVRGYARALSKTTAATFYRDADDLVRLSNSETLAPRFASLACPTLFIAGVPGGICERSHQLLAAHRVRCVDIPRSGHWPFIDNPDAFARAVADFAARHA